MPPDDPCDDCSHWAGNLNRGDNMNRFIINYSPDLIARDLCDKHVVKMPLEEAQMLCTILRLHAPEYAEEAGLYRAVHQEAPMYHMGRAISCQL